MNELPEIPMNGHTLPTFMRGRAIGSYANLEFSLCFLLATLLEVDLKKAGLIFYRVVNTRSRNSIINDLFHDKHGDQYDLFWNSTLKLIRQLDSERNEIAHWHFVNEMNLEPGQRVNIGDQNLGESVLRPPGSWFINDNKTRKTHNDMQEFVKKCEYVARALTVFNHLIDPRMEKTSADEPWLRICHEPIPYPPPDNHPLSPNYIEPQNPPASSQG